MLEQIEKLKNKQHIVIMPQKNQDIIESLENTLGNIITIGNEQEEKKVVELINNSKLKKIYLIDNCEYYRFLLPRLKKDIKVCWVFKNSFSDLSNGKVRYTLHCIMEFIDRNLIDSIGCVNIDNLKVFENAGYKCEYIDLKIKQTKNKFKESNSIGILSNDYDPNNNFYNQLAALTFVDYDICKFKYIMKATKEFIKFFNLKCKKVDDIEDAIKGNFVNLYINFTNTNNELIEKSFDIGIPCIVGNTNIFDKNKYLKDNLVVKSDDDINEIVEKINFARNNREKIISEYNK